MGAGQGSSRQLDTAVTGSSFDAEPTDRGWHSSYGNGFEWAAGPLLPMSTQQGKASSANPLVHADAGRRALRLEHRRSGRTLVADAHGPRAQRWEAAWGRRGGGGVGCRTGRGSTCPATGLGGRWPASGGGLLVELIGGRCRRPAARRLGRTGRSEGRGGPRAAGSPGRNVNRRRTGGIRGSWCRSRRRRRAGDRGGSGALRTRAAPVDAQGAALAGAADRSFRPDGGEESEPVAACAVRLCHRSYCSSVA